MRSILMVCWTGLLAVSLCPGSVCRPKVSVPQVLPGLVVTTRTVKPAPLAHAPRPSSQGWGRIASRVRPRPDEPVLVILYGGQPGSWM